MRHLEACLEHPYTGYTKPMQMADLTPQNQLLADLLPMVQRLCESIQARGLVFPILAHRITEEDWGLFKAQKPVRAYYRHTVIDGMVATIFVGNRRVRAASLLGYGSIDVIASQDLDWLREVKSTFRDLQPELILEYK